MFTRDVILQVSGGANLKPRLDSGLYSQGNQDFTADSLGEVKIQHAHFDGRGRLISGMKTIKIGSGTHFCESLKKLIHAKAEDFRAKWPNAEEILELILEDESIPLPISSRKFLSELVKTVDEALQDL
jgi:hypothetical protein